MNKTVSVSLTIFCLLSSVSLLSLLLSLPATEASATIYIRADGSIDPPTASITTVDNITYTVTRNIHESIVVERSNIVFNAAGYVIDGYGTGAGFSLQEVSNVTIKHAHIIGFYYGVYLSYTSKIFIHGCNITANIYDAVHLRESIGNTISKNNITKNGNDGIALWGLTNNTIISGNKIVENGGRGIYFVRGDVGTCSNSIISGNNLTGNYDTGIYVSHSSNVSISTNDVKDHSYGIRIFNCSDCTLKKNKLVANDGYGLKLLVFSNSSITGNNLTNNNDGIDLNRCNNNIISGNYLADNIENGLYIMSSSNNVFYNNTITTHICGVQLEWSPNCVFSANTIAHNDVGFNISVSPLAGNRFFHNNFINNTMQTTILAGISLWDNGYEGNYWSDYVGVDSNKDGIGDSQHIISGTNVDNLPLMGMFTSFNTSLSVYVNVISNSTIHTFDLSKSTTNSTIEMYVSNITSPQHFGFCRICIPHVLMTEQYKAYVEGSEPEYANYNLYDNTTHRWVFFSYNHSTVNVIIQGVDNEPPTIELISPQNITYVTGNVPLSFNIYEPTSWIGYSLDKQANVTIQGSTELTGLSEGSHTITVYANDTADNMGSQTEWFTVDTTAPTVVIVSPENKSYPTGSLTLNFTVNEPTSWIGYSLNGQTNQTIQGNTTLPVLPDGPHNIIVYANDTMGNMGHSSTIYFTVDTIHPTIQILSPQNTTYTTNTPPLDFTVNEPTSWIGYSLNGQTNQTIQGNTTLPVLPDGPHNIIVYANDTAGNMAASNIVYFTVDATPPEITDVSQTPPRDYVTPESLVRVNATITDSTSGVKRVTLNYTTNNGTWFSVEMHNYEGNFYNGTIPSFDYCTYVNYTIVAEDIAGNTITTKDMAYELNYHVVPEFPSLTILLLLMIMTSLTLIIARRKKKN